MEINFVLAESSRCDSRQVFKDHYKNKKIENLFFEVQKSKIKSLYLRLKNKSVYYKLSIHCWSGGVNTNFSFVFITSLLSIIGLLHCSNLNNKFNRFWSWLK